MIEKYIQQINDIANKKDYPRKLVVPKDLYDEYVLKNPGQLFGPCELTYDTIKNT